MKGLIQRSRGQMGAGSAVTLVVTVVVAMVVASVLVPVAIDQIEGDDTTTLTTSVGATDEVNAELNTTLDSVDGTVSPSTATITLNDTRTSTTVTNTIANGSSATYSLEGGDVTVSVTSVDSGNNQATADYTYTKDYAFSSGATALWGILGLAIVVGIFLYAISLATDQF